MSSPGINFALNNPIIGAYVTGLNIRRQQEQQQFQNEFAKNQAKTQQDQFSQQQKLHQQIQDYYEKHIDQETAMQQAQLDAEREQHKLNAIQTLAPLFAQGLIHSQGGMQQSPQGGPTQLGIPQGVGNQEQAQQPLSPVSNQGQMAQMLANPQSPTATTQNQPASMSFGGQNFSFSSPEEMLARQRQLNDESVRVAGATAGAQANARLPSEIALRQTEADLQAKNAKDLEDQRAANELKRTEAMNRSAQIVEGMRANASRDVARISATMGLSSDDFAKLLPQYTDGVQKLPSGKPGIIIGQHIAGSNQVPVDPAKIEKLDSLHSLDTLRNNLEAYANSLPDDRLGALIQSGKAMFPGETRARQQQIAGEIPLALKNLEGVNRFNKAEADVIGKALGDISTANTRSEALAKLKSFDSQYKSKAVNEILGGVPEEQRTRILAQHNFNPDGSAVAHQSYVHTATNQANGHKIGSNDGQTWYDLQTGAKLQ